MGKKKVMVVDDDPDFLEMLQDVLTIESYDVISCRDPEEATAMARQWLPGTIITDLKMPGLSGLKVIERLRSDPATKDINIILCSAYPRVAEARGAQLASLGCKFLAKPFEFNDLLNLLAAGK